MPLDIFCVCHEKCAVQQALFCAEKRSWHAAGVRGGMKVSMVRSACGTSGQRSEQSLPVLMYLMLICMEE